MAASIQRPRRPWGRPFAFVLVTILLTSGLGRPAAHDLPASVLAQVFVKPEGKRMRMLIRVPLVSMRDFAFPRRPDVLDGTVLDLAAIEPMLVDAAQLWLVPAVPVFEDGSPLPDPAVTAARIALPGDRSFDSYDRAVAHFAEPPLPPDSKVPTTSALLDVMLEYGISSEQSRFSMEPQLARLGLRVITSVRFQPPGREERAFQFVGDPGRIELDPSAFQASRTFVGFGFEHILDGIDHLLFLFCLVLPLRRFWQLVGVVTSFTVAHSITLFIAAFGWTPSALWFPPLIEALIALSIVYMALENIIVWATWWAGPFRRSSDATAPSVGPRPALHGRWMIAFAFGLVHGFGFSFALQETLQFAGSHIVLSLLAFNVGVELGQVLVLAILLPILALTFKYLVDERIGIIVASALVAHTAWHWLTERVGALWEYDWSLTDPATLAQLLRMLMVFVAVVGAVWLVRVWSRSRRTSRL